MKMQIRFQGQKRSRNDYQEPEKRTCESQSVKVRGGVSKRPKGITIDGVGPRGGGEKV